MAHVLVDVRGNEPGVDVIDSDVLPLVSLHLPALYPGEGGHGDLGHDVGGLQPAVSLVVPGSRGVLEVLHQRVELVVGEVRGGQDGGELLRLDLVPGLDPTLAVRSEDTLDQTVVKYCGDLKICSPQQVYPGTREHWTC